jgi:hypothetical protein
MRSWFRENADYLSRQSKLAAMRAELSLLKAVLRSEAKYSPDQPRVPAGNPDGGQWTNDNDNDVTGSTDLQPAPYLLAAGGKQSAAYCWNQMQIDMLLCASLRPAPVNAACRAQANERYSACLAGKPIPPLPF